MEPIMTAVQQFIVTVVVGLIGVMSAVAIAYLGVLKQKAIESIQNIKDERVRNAADNAIQKAYTLVSDVVTKLEQEEKQEILAAIEDGEMSRDDLFNLKRIAVSTVADRLGPEAIKILTDTFGDVYAYIGDLVSAQVYALKHADEELPVIEVDNNSATNN